MYFAAKVSYDLANFKVRVKIECDPYSFNVVSLYTSISHEFIYPPKNFV